MRCNSTLANIPDSELTPFMHTGSDVLSRYVGNVVRRAEHARLFGARGEKLEDMISKIREESWLSGRPLRGDEEKRIRDLAGVLGGTYGRVQNRLGRSANDWVATYQYVRTLPLTTLSSLSEAFVAMERGGPKAWAKALPDTAKHVARQTLRMFTKGVDKAEATKQLERLGLGLDETLAEVLSGQLSSGKATTAQKAFFKATGLNSWTRMTQVLAMKTGENLIRDNLDRVVKGTAKPRMLRELKELGLDVDQAKAWAQAGGSKEHGYWPDIEKALLRFTNSVIMNPRGTVKPLYMSSQHFKLMTMLKGFNTMAGNTIVKRMGTKLAKGDMVERGRVLSGAGLMVTTAFLAQEVKDYIKYGLEGNPRTKNESAGDMAWRLMGRAGLTGVFQFADDVWNAQRFGSSGVQQLAGPAVSQAEELIQGAKQAWDGKSGKLQTEVLNAIPGINLNKPVLREGTREFLFGERQ